VAADMETAGGSGEGDARADYIASEASRAAQQVLGGAQQ
jgi:hypothetical protein